MKLSKQLLPATLLLLAIPVATVLAGMAIGGTMPNLRLWTWSSLIWVAIGLPFLLVQRQAGFPSFVPGRGWFAQSGWQVFLAGMVFGLLDVLVIKVVQHPQPYSELPPFLQPFPYSLLLYTSGALVVEVMYRLIPLTVIMLLAHRFASPAWQQRIFLIAAVLNALREPLEQWPAGPTWFLVYAFVTGFGMNLLQAACFHKHGFTASLLVRLGHYLVWHILLGVYVQVAELTS